ncbi:MULTISPECIES: AAA family ATPase [unclassified Leifsonia]|uniref:AAA family ATPase n=1 Tax=unclassified Leifsonia TaxID=2663824 RepID=UPI001414F909|nr:MULTISPECIES: AAA family ATPase [unclassified Leifsonia]
MIDNDMAVSENYQRLLMQTIDGVYDESLPADMPRAAIRDRVIGQVRDAMRVVFPDLELTGVGGVAGTSASEGTFYFAKGNSNGFLYKNLSAGEKAAFDLLLDGVIKREYFNNSIWCIDEPETHLNSRIQASLLVALVDLLPPGCQLWLASHSIGFMRKAWEIAKADPGSVAFIDMEGVDYDFPVNLTPIEPSREFWARTLNVALGDVAALVAPEHVVLCEGRPSTGPADVNAAYDAECYRRIFKSTHPEADFISVGNSSDTTRDRLGVGHAIQTISAGTLVTRVVDRDYKSEEEIAALEAIGTRVLSRRHIEAYLFDEEVIAELCVSEGALDKIGEAQTIRAEAIAASVRRGNDHDDIKRAAGTIAEGLRRLLSLSGAGSTAEAFARDTLAKHLLPRMAVYQELEQVIFGERGAAAPSLE